jgi:hypothetical protein
MIKEIVEIWKMILKVIIPTVLICWGLFNILWFLGYVFHPIVVNLFEQYQKTLF